MQSTCLTIPIANIASELRKVHGLLSVQSLTDPAWTRNDGWIAVYRSFDHSLVMLLFGKSGKFGTFPKITGHSLYLYCIFLHCFSPRRVISPLFLLLLVSGLDTGKDGVSARVTSPEETDRLCANVSLGVTQVPQSLRWFLHVGHIERRVYVTRCFAALVLIIRVRLTLLHDFSDIKRCPLFLRSIGSSWRHNVQFHSPLL